MKVFPFVEGYKDMQSRLDGSDDCKSDLQIWGVVKSKYTVGDLIEWIEKQKGKKGKSPSKSVATFSTNPQPRVQRERSWWQHQNLELRREKKRK